MVCLMKLAGAAFFYFTSEYFAGLVGSSGVSFCGLSFKAGVLFVCLLGFVLNTDLRWPSFVTPLLVFFVHI